MGADLIAFGWFNRAPRHLSMRMTFEEAEKKGVTPGAKLRFNFFGESVPIRITGMYRHSTDSPAEWHVEAVEDL